MSDATADQLAALNDKLLRLANIQADTYLKEAQIRLAGLQERNLGADSALKEAQEKLAFLQRRNFDADTGLKRDQARWLPWQVWSAGLTAGAAGAGTLIAIGHFL